MASAAMQVMIRFMRFLRFYFEMNNNGNRC
jgi:hypothetical protein